MQADISNPDQERTAARQRAMAICAEATRDELNEALAAIGYDGAAEDLRQPEIGLVMARGRVGGDGRPFNLGEVTVARAAVRLAGGETGFAYQLGRDVAKARVAAIFDALIQSPHAAAAAERALSPIAARIANDNETKARQVQATRVNFFTMVRGED